ncbi:MAG: hypothetical protein ACLSB9_27970 [Hydrogeniiclostridium mannosilyticum]
MAALLLCLMAYQITGRRFRWFGAGMLLLFIAHHILNIRWYGNLFREIQASAHLQTIVNFSVLISCFVLDMVIVLSRHVARFYGGPWLLQKYARSLL